MQIGKQENVHIDEKISTSFFLLSTFLLLLRRSRPFATLLLLLSARLLLRLRIETRFGHVIIIVIAFASAHFLAIHVPVQGWENVFVVEHVVQRQKIRLFRSHQDRRWLTFRENLHRLNRSSFIAMLRSPTTEAYREIGILSGIVQCRLSTAICFDIRRVQVIEEDFDDIMSSVLRSLNDGINARLIVHTRMARTRINGDRPDVSLTSKST